VETPDLFLRTILPMVMTHPLKCVMKLLELPLLGTLDELEHFGHLTDSLPSLASIVGRGWGRIVGHSG
jgi:hypothetical protein